jgi:hypothetical protein
LGNQPAEMKITRSLGHTNRLAASTCSYIGQIEAPPEMIVPCGVKP